MRTAIHLLLTYLLTYLHTRPFNGPFTVAQVSRYQKGKTNLDFTEARASGWQWHQLDHTQDCTSLQTDNHASTPPLSFLQAGCPSSRTTNSVKALKTRQSYDYLTEADRARFTTTYLTLGWLGSRVVSVLDSGAEGPGFKSQSRRCRVTVLGKLFTPIVPLFTKQQNW